MENSCLVKALLYNNSDKPLLVRTPDFTELNGTEIPSYCSLPITVKFPNTLKLVQERWFTEKGNPVIYIMLVDKDY